MGGPDRSGRPAASRHRHRCGLREDQVIVRPVIRLGSAIRPLTACSESCQYSAVRSGVVRNEDPLLNEQSLQAANAFLRVASSTIQVGDFLDQAPADIGRAAGLPNPLAVARAVRALAARRRLEVEDGRYRLTDARALDPGE